MSGKFSWWTFAQGEDDEERVVWVVVDDRDTKKNNVQLHVDNNGALMISKSLWKNYKWSPTLLIPVDSRRTPDEAKKLADCICDALNANWVKEKMEQT